MPNGSGHRRRLVRRTVERLVQLLHFAWPKRLSPENWCFCVENGVFFRFWGSFWGDFGDFGTRNRHFFSFFGVTSPLRAGVGVFGSAPHLLNVSDEAEAACRR